MVITIDILKKINSSIASGSFMTMRELACDCYLDEKILERIFGSLEQPVRSMGLFFSTINQYIAEMQKRVKMLNECYTAVQKAQIAGSAIKATQKNPDPPIIW
ncbi:MAG: hypothetical protein LBQ36_02990 [Synergistaceae bacterium]|nr:hypothetical protein [Synergistaceae bacterium]